MCALPPLLSYIFKANFAGFLNKKVRETALMQAFEATRCAYWFCLTSLFMDIPANLESLLRYKQKINHFRWLTAANGYRPVLLFHSSNLTTVEKTKLSTLCVIYFFCIFALISDDTP